MDNKFRELHEMAQNLVDNNLLTKDQKINLSINDYQPIKLMYEKLTIGLLTISKWEKKKFDHIYNKIN